MPCFSPLRLPKVGLVSCGQCRGCRIRKLADWKARCLLETAASKSAFFLTLTRRDPPSDLVTVVDQSLRPRELELFWKRLRRRFGYVKYRYLAVGEYGERSGRAHYHALVWTDRVVSAEAINNAVSKAWTAGFVHVGTVTGQSITYTIEYAFKSAREWSAEICDGRVPPFARFSQGIGRAAIAELGRLCEVDPETGEVLLEPRFRVEGKEYFWPKYVRRRIASGVTPNEIDQEISVLREALLAVPAGTAASSLEQRRLLRAAYAKLLASEAQKEALIKARAINSERKLKHRRSKNETF